jgi:hypothetical protein
MDIYLLPFLPLRARTAILKTSTTKQPTIFVNLYTWPKKCISPFKPWLFWEASASPWPKRASTWNTWNALYVDNDLIQIPCNGNIRSKSTTNIQKKKKSAIARSTEFPSCKSSYKLDCFCEAQKAGHGSPARLQIAQEAEDVCAENGVRMFTLPYIRGKGRSRG